MAVNGIYNPKKIYKNRNSSNPFDLGEINVFLIAIE